MYVKMMSNQNLPDAHSGKTFTLIECNRVTFGRAPDGAPVAYVNWPSAEGILCEGNVYVLNREGKTIESFSFNAPPPHAEGEPHVTGPKEKFQ